MQSLFFNSSFLFSLNLIWRNVNQKEYSNRDTKKMYSESSRWFAFFAGNISFDSLISKSSRIRI